MGSRGRTRWCAIYTRKSSEEGLEQEFNSLDAQREAAAAYIKSQTQEGWRRRKGSYDDGGYSGGNLERPGLKRLLEDIRARKVDVVVVYKVDRLTRSLRDFAKLVETFEEHGISFVSVTQQFNTTTSMGRLMLNVLLSFAQFEREVTGERIRDKIAASKKKGMWTGGVPPMGYEVRDKKLVVKPADAAVVAHIFDRYSRLGSISKLVAELVATGHRTRRYMSGSGKVTGGRPFSRGHLQRILTNRIYLGEVVHAGVAYPGEHEAIIGRALWDHVQGLLDRNRQVANSGERLASRALLKELLFDDAGNRMSPSYTIKGGRQYRYYVSQAVIQNQPGQAGCVSRLPAYEIEELVTTSVRSWLAEHASSGPGLVRRGEFDEIAADQLVRRLVRRVVVDRGALRIEVAPVAEVSPERSVDATEQDEHEPVELRVPFTFRPHGGRTLIHAVSEGRPVSYRPDPALTRALGRAWSWRGKLESGEATSISELARQAGVTRPYVTRILRLAFLAPSLIEAILEGRQPDRLNLEQLRDPIPLGWDEQYRFFGQPFSW